LKGSSPTLRVFCDTATLAAAIRTVAAAAQATPLDFNM
jgi:hypothetical protein